MLRSVILLCLSAVLIAACGQQKKNPVLLATTTSLEDSGLLGYLITAFEEETGIPVKAIAVGSGRAFQLGRGGEVDLLLTHSPAEEASFLKDGYGSLQREVMYNHFVLLGPPTDPAGIRGMTDASSALLKILENGASFFSRGDGSGTHIKELALWEATGVQPGGEGYRETGQGMGSTLRITDEMVGYTLSDMGTYMSQKDKLDLVVLVGRASNMKNVYRASTINPVRFPHINAEGAERLIEWLTSPRGQELIGNYRIDNEQLFYPAIKSTSPGVK